MRPSPVAPVRSSCCRSTSHGYRQRRLVRLSISPEAPTDPLVAIVPDRHGRGTNALVLRPPDVIDFCFGGDSWQAHLEAARAADATIETLDGPLTLDIDTPEDLLLAQAETPEAVGG